MAVERSATSAALAERPEGSSESRRAGGAKGAARAAKPSSAPAARAGRRNPRSARHLEDGPPNPPWHPFPLAELSIFIALVLAIVGFIVWGRRGEVMVGLAFVLGSLATLEFTIREHVGGYRSHTVLLAGVAAIATGALTYVAGAGRPITLGVAATLFVVAAVGLREVFKRRSGGLGWRGGLR